MSFVTQKNYRAERKQELARERKQEQKLRKVKSPRRDDAKAARLENEALNHGAINLPKVDPDNLLTRAYAAYFRYGSDGVPQQPSQNLSGVRVHKGLKYIVLANTVGTLAVYRLTNQGQLRILRRWPKEVG